MSKKMNERTNERPKISALKMHRILQGVSQEEVAFKVGMTQQAYSKLERGFSIPSYDRKEALAKFFGVDPERLFPDK